MIAATMPNDLDARDPAFIRAALPVLAPFFEHYHQLDVRGLDRVGPGAALVVGNHNGGIMAPDMFALMVAFWSARGTEEPAYGLMHDLVYKIPVVRDALSRMGAVAAHPDTALRLLARGAKVLVYPGGDLDAFKAWERRHEIVFGERRGFIRLALRARAPIVPVVSVGAHEGFHVLSDGVELAQRTGLKRLFRLEALPIALGLPFGLVVGPTFYLPLPVRMKLRVLDPIAWPELDARAADDDAQVARCRSEVVDAMQRAMDELVAEGGFGRRWPRGSPR